MRLSWGGRDEMLRWMCGHTKNKFHFDHIKGGVSLVPIEEEMGENYLRWFGHIQVRGIGKDSR